MPTSGRTQKLGRETRGSKRREAFEDTKMSFKDLNGSPELDLPYSFSHPLSFLISAILCSNRLLTSPSWLRLGKKRAANLPARLFSFCLPFSKWYLMERKRKREIFKNAILQRGKREQSVIRTLCEKALRKYLIGFGSDNRATGQTPVHLTPFFTCRACSTRFDLCLIQTK